MHLFYELALELISLYKTKTAYKILTNNFQLKIKINNIIRDKHADPKVEIS